MLRWPPARRSPIGARSQRWIVAVTVASALGCGDGSHRGSAAGDMAVAGTWVTAPTAEFGSADGGFAGFRRIGDVRTGANGERVYVVDPLDYRTTAWSPDGELLFSVGGEGDGPGEFRWHPHTVHATSQGLRVLDSRRVVEFSRHGRHLTTVPLPSSLGSRFSPRALLGDGSMFAYSGIDAYTRAGFWGDDPVDRLPIVRLSETDGLWTVDTVGVLDVANASLVVGGPENGVIAGAVLPQRFGDVDQAVYDVESETVVVVRTSGMAPGQVDLTELSADGDTVWSRRLGFQPRPLPASLVDATIDSYADFVVDSNLMEGHSAGAVRSAVADAFYAPEHYPPVRDDVTLASTGELWMRTVQEAGADSLYVWYAVRVGAATDAPLRRILLPRWLTVHDATETHVWGVRRDALGVDHVVGRRLIRQEQEEPQE